MDFSKPKVLIDLDEYNHLKQIDNQVNFNENEIAVNVLKTNAIKLGLALGKLQEEHNEGKVTISKIVEHIIKTIEN